LLADVGAELKGSLKADRVAWHSLNRARLTDAVEYRVDASVGAALDQREQQLDDFFLTLVTLPN